MLRATRRRRALQRVVGLGPHPGGRRARREPPVVEGRGVRAGVRRAGPVRAGPGLSVFSYLRPRTELWVAAQFAAAAAVPPRLSQLQPRLPPGPGANASTTGAVAATSAASSTSSWPRSWTACDLEAVFAGDEPLQNPANEERFRTLLGLGAGPKPFECVGDIDECRAATVLAAQRTGSGRHRAPDASARRAAGDAAPADPAALAAAAGHPPHPGALCASRSPGPRSLTRPSASGGWASRDRPASAGCAAMGRDAGPGRRRARRTPRSTGSRSWRPGPAAWTRSGRCDVVVKSPGISRYRPEVAQLEEAGVAVCGGLGLFMAEADPTRVACITGHEGEEHDDRTGRAPARAGSASTPGQAGTSACRRGTPPAARQPEYWIIETSSFQVPDLRNAPVGGGGHLPVAGPSRLARDRRALLRRQIVAVHQARGGAGPRRRRRRGAAQAQAGLLGPHLRWVSDADGGAGRPVGQRPSA